MLAVFFAQETRKDIGRVYLFFQIRKPDDIIDKI